MLINLNIWTKTIFKSDLKKRALPPNGNLLRYGQNKFFKNYLKKRRFRRYLDIFGYMDKKQFLKGISKKRTLNGYIYGDIDKEQVFFKIISKNVIFSKC